jgi:hypothetical protein
MAVMALASTGMSCLELMRGGASWTSEWLAEAIFDSYEERCSAIGE